MEKIELTLQLTDLHILQLHVAQPKRIYAAAKRIDLIPSFPCLSGGCVDED